MKVYKVVCVKNKKGEFFPTSRPGADLVSVCGGYMSLTYRMKKMIYPKIGRLFGFKSFESAVDYVRCGGFGSVVLEGEATDAKRTMFMANCRFEDFWDAKNRRQKPKLGQDKSPPGTVTFASFFPKRIVFEKGAVK